MGYKDATRSPKSVASAFISLCSFVELNEEDQYYYLRIPTSTKDPKCSGKVKLTFKISFIKKSINNLVSMLRQKEDCSVSHMTDEAMVMIESALFF